MFDWPEPIHTSPMRMSSSSILFFPLMVMVWALPSAFTAGSTTFQLPWASALAVAVASSSLTVTSSPGAAQPQIGNGRSRCSTMWLPITLGSVTLAWAWGTVTKRRAGTRKQRTRQRLFMADLSCGKDVVRGWGGRLGRIPNHRLEQAQGMAGTHIGSIVVSAWDSVNYVNLAFPSHPGPSVPRACSMRSGGFRNQ